MDFIKIQNIRYSREKQSFVKEKKKDVLNKRMRFILIWNDYSYSTT